MNPNFLMILAEVAAERNRQDAKWGGPTHDDTHGPSDWCRFIDQQMDEFPRTGGMQRYLFIRIAALALAAVESYDRLERKALTNNGAAEMTEDERAELIRRRFEEFQSWAPDFARPTCRCGFDLVAYYGQRYPEEYITGCPKCHESWCD